MELNKQLLKTGKEILGLELGIISKVVGDKYELIAIDDVTNVFKPGEILSLNKTFCRDLVSDGKTIALTEFENTKGLIKHPVYAVSALEAYIGAAIYLNDAIWGTINFSSMKLRDTEFSQADINMIESYAFLISDSISS